MGHALVVRQGRIFTQDMHDELARAEANEEGLKHISAAMRAELEWWLEALRQGKGTQMMLQRPLAMSQSQPFSDASSEWGMAGVIGPKVWQHEWTRAESRLVNRNTDPDARIAIGEMAAVCVTAGLCASEWQGKIVEFRCDNIIVCHAVNNGRCKIKRVREMVRWLMKLAVSEQGRGFHIYLRYVPSKFNLADRASRQVVDGQVLIDQKKVEEVLKSLPNWPR